MSTMNTKCRMKNCEWTGDQNELFCHCEDRHKERIIEQGVQSKVWKFDTDDLENDIPFLLCSPYGLYWLAPEPRKTDKIIKWGIFHVGDSLQLACTIKFGSLREGHCEYIGPIISRDETDEVYDITLVYEYINYLKVDVKAKEFLVYLGNFDDSDDVYEPTYEDLIFNEEDEKVNKICVAKFTCPVCFQFIKSHIRYCENKHFVCVNCFHAIGKSGKMRCPVCRVNYTTDYSSQRLERFLRMVKFPESDDIDDPVEIPKRQIKPKKAEQTDQAVQTEQAEKEQQAAEA